MPISQPTCPAIARVRIPMNISEPLAYIYPHSEAYKSFVSRLRCAFGCKVIGSTVATSHYSTFHIEYHSPNATMSFELGVDDFLTAGKLVWDVYSAYADAPKQFWNFSQEILSLHIVFEQVEEQLHNTTTLSTKDTHHLKTLYERYHGGTGCSLEKIPKFVEKSQCLI